MIRSMQQSDAPEVLALLEWMDDRPEREVLAPESRSSRDLCWESEGKVCLVDVDDAGSVRGYCSVSSAGDVAPGGGMVLEGPLGEGPLVPLVRRALTHADGSVYAFCARDNAVARDALERAGFLALHTTEFFALRRSEVREKRLPDLPPGARVARRLDRDAYMRLYRSGEDVWSSRLHWSYAEYVMHFSREDVRLVALVQDSQALGFAELELDEVAHVTYVAVHPAERGRGLGRALVAAAVREAFARPEVREVRARAHDHEVVAQRVYAALGFRLCRAVVTYLRDGPV